MLPAPVRRPRVAPRGWPVWQRVALAGLGALLLALGQTSSALGHADLVGAEPADGAVLDQAPERVRLSFTEPVEPEFFVVQVYSADRARVDRGDTRVSPTDARVLETSLVAIGPGAYTIAWRALSLDSHAVRGTFAFTVGSGAAPGRPLDLALPASGAPFAVEAAARWLTFLGLFVLLGGFAFPPLVLQPALRRAALGSPHLVGVAQRRWAAVAWVCLAGLLLLSFASLLFQASSAAGVPLSDVLSGRAVTRLLTATKYGVLWLVRVPLLLALAGVLAWLVAAPANGPRRAWWVGSALAAGALLTLSATGHASAVQSQPAAMAIAVDWLHLLAGGVWIGGLVQLALTLPPIVAEADPDGRRRLLGQLVPRFSWLAGLSVLVLVVSGAYAGWLYIPTPSALLDTVYGAALSGKLLLVAPLLLLGAVNLLVLHPRVRQAGALTPRPREDRGAARALGLVVAGELVLATAVLGVTGVLAGLPPAASAVMEAAPFSEVRRTTAGRPITLAISPNQAGENTITVELAGAAAGEPSTPQSVQLTLVMLDVQRGARRVEVPAAAVPGRFELRGGHLSMPGNWAVDVTARQADGVEETARFLLLVGEPPGADRPAFSPGRVLLLAANGRTLLAAALLVAAGILLAGARRPRGGWRRAPPAALAPLALLGVGLVLAGTSVAQAYRLSLPNPVPADAGSLMRGEAVYFNNGCALCHGVSGRGDGPDGRLLRPRPADFRVHLAAGHTDRELYDWIAGGVPGTAMQAFKGTLTEQEHWDVINFIRTFGAR